MKKSTILFFLISAALLMGTALSAAGNGNVLLNPGFKLTPKGKFLHWWMSNSSLMKSLVEAPDGNYVKMPCVEKISKGKKRYGNVFSQTISNPKAGTYIYGVDLSPSQKFAYVRIVIYYKGKDGKTVFKGAALKHNNYPAPGKWTRLPGKLSIPEGVKRVTFCVEIVAKKAGGDLLIKSPSLQLREE